MPTQNLESKFMAIKSDRHSFCVGEIKLNI